MRKIGAEVILSMILMTATKAHALKFEQRQIDGKNVFVVTEEFESGDSASFDRAIARAGHVDEVWFSSPGGSVDEGLAIGSKIRSLKLATRVPKGARCDSICTFAFLGGVIREVDTGGKYGVHMFSAWCAPETAQGLYRRVRGFLGQNGCSKEAAAALTAEIVEIAQAQEKQSAIAARKMADYLMEMEVSLRLLVPNFETGEACKTTNVLSREQLLSYNVVNTVSR
jgi:hypothetical protein